MEANGTSIAAGEQVIRAGVRSPERAFSRFDIVLADVSVERRIRGREGLHVARLEDDDGDGLR